MKWNWNSYVMRKHCVQCERLFCVGDMIFYTDNGYGMFICQICAERENMSNIKITAEVNGKQVPLETISTETFEAIKALEKSKEIPVARLTTYDHSGEPRLLFRPTEVIQLKAGRIYSLDLRRGKLASDWEPEGDEYAVKSTYPGNVTIL